MDLLKEKVTQDLLAKHIESIKLWGFIVLDDVVQLEIDINNRIIKYVGNINKKSSVSDNPGKRQEAVDSYVKQLLGEDWNAAFEKNYGRIRKNIDDSSKPSKRKRTRNL